MSLPMKWYWSTSGLCRNCGEVDALLREMRLEAREIADRRVEPDVEVLARRVRDRDAEVRRIARDVPVGEPLAAVAAPSPSHSQRLVRDLGLQPSRRAASTPQELDAGRVGEPEEEMLRRSCARASRRRPSSTGFLRSVGELRAPQDFAGVAVLVLRAAFRALALDVAVRQEHLPSPGRRTARPAWSRSSDGTRSRSRR